MKKEGDFLSTGAKNLLELMLLQKGKPIFLQLIEEKIGTYADKIPSSGAIRYKDDTVKIEASRNTQGQLDGFVRITMSDRQGSKTFSGRFENGIPASPLKMKTRTDNFGSYIQEEIQSFDGRSLIGVQKISNNGYETTYKYDEARGCVKSTTNKLVSNRKPMYVLGCIGAFLTLACGAYYCSMSASDANPSLPSDEKPTPASATPSNPIPVANPSFQPDEKPTPASATPSNPIPVANPSFQPDEKPTPVIKSSLLPEKNNFNQYTL